MTIKTLSLGIALAALVGTTSELVIAQRSSSSQGGSSSSVKPASPSQPSGRQSGPQRPTNRKPWWQDDATVKELGLTPDQAKQIEQIYTSAKDEMGAYMEAFKREEAELDRLVAESKVEQWVVMRQIDRTETQRANFNKLRTMTLYRMSRQLTPDQRVKLQAIRDRDHRDPRKRP